MTHDIVNADHRTHVDLFTGLGGFSLAAQACGLRTVVFCEHDDRCQRFLAKAWPGIPCHEDIKTFDGTKHRGAFLMPGGPPCQPVSCAGKRRGAKDDRWLWPDALRILSEVQPTWALLENPSGIGGMGLDGILADVEAQGYEVRVFSIPACAVGAPHRRERYWIVCRRLADAGEELSVRETKTGRTSGAERIAAFGTSQGDVADAAEPRHQRTDTESRPYGRRAERRQGTLGDAESLDGRTRARWSNRPEHGNANPWGNYVWLPCADGKLRRAPACPICLASGVPGKVSEGLAECENKIEAHRSLLAALGNAVVPEIPTRIIRAMLDVDGNL